MNHSKLIRIEQFRFSYLKPDLQSRLGQNMI